MPKNFSKKGENNYERNQESTSGFAFGNVINLWRKTHMLAYGMKATLLLLDKYID